MSVNRNRHSQPASLPLPVSNAAAYVSRLSACNVARILAHGCACVCPSTRAFARASMQHVRVPRVLHDEYTYALLIVVYGTLASYGRTRAEDPEVYRKAPPCGKTRHTDRTERLWARYRTKKPVPPLCGTLSRGRRQRLQSAQRPF